MAKNYKDEYLESIKETDPDWLDYYKKKIAWVVNLDGGRFVAIERPDINTRFAYHYGCYGISDPEEENRATEKANAVETEASVFISENLADYLDRCPLKELDEGTVLLSFSNGGHLGGYSVISLNDYWRRGYDRLKETNPTLYSQLDFKELTQQDREELKAGYLMVLDNFKARLNAYIKRYGLSKVQAWTYLLD